MSRMNKVWGILSATLLSFTGLAQALPENHLSLPDCISAALAGNPDIQSAEHRVEAARAGIQEAWSAYYPQLGLSGTYARSDNPPQAFFMKLNQRQASMEEDFNHPDDTENLRLSVGAKIRLLDAGQRTLGIQAAELGTEASVMGLRMTQNELIYQVTRGYYGVLQAQRYVQVLQETLASIEESLRVAQERYKAGSTVQTDVLSLEVREAEAKDDLIRAKNGVQLAIAALNTAIGDNLVTAGNIRDDSQKNPEPPSDLSDVDDISRRPEMRAAQLFTRVQEKMWTRANREHYPVLSAFGTADWDSDVSSDFENSYFAGAMAEWDFFTGFRKKAAASRARAEFAAAKADEEKTAQQLRLDLKSASLKAGESWERLDVTRKSLESAEEALRITQEQYRQGAADITILLNAQVGLTAMRTRHVTAQYDYLSSLANLARARGDLVSQYVSTKGE